MHYRREPRHSSDVWSASYACMWHQTPFPYANQSSPRVILYTLTGYSITSRRYHDPEASLEEGLATLRRCIDEVSKRLVVSPGKYKVKVVDKDGVREIEL